MSYPELMPRQSPSHTRNWSGWSTDAPGPAGWPHDALLDRSAVNTTPSVVTIPDLAVDE
jgi:hypothetical protein